MLSEAHDLPGVQGFICCLGSGRSTDPEQLSAARGVGRLIARANNGMVYGGGRFGVMGSLAEGYLAAGGSRLVAINLEYYEARGRTADIGHIRIRANSRRDRVNLFLRHADRFMVLPGGIGTVEELFILLADRETEQVAGIEFCIVNIGGYFDGLIAWLAMAEQKGLCGDSKLRLDVVSSLTNLPWV